MKLRPAPLVIVLLLAGCAQVPSEPLSPAHLSRADAPRPAAAAPIPAPVQNSIALPPPQAAPTPETYSVVVHDVAVDDLLFALARDARLNVDIHPGLGGRVTLNAINQTLPQLLDRIAKQVDLRYELNGANLTVMPDTPFLRTYKVDYVAMNRDTSSVVALATQIASAGASTVGAPGTQQATGTGNSSVTRIENSAHNHFWDTLEENVRDILRETDTVAGGVASAPATDRGAADTAATGTSTAGPARHRQAGAVIANPETGVLTIRATSRQHARIQEFLDRVVASARRQVLIEATVVEVQLSRNYQQGIDWSKMNFAGSGLTLVQHAAGQLSAPPSSLFELAYTSGRGSFTGSIKLLESFGNVHVLSSPKVSVLNNQTAVLKVVDNAVYFTMQSDVSQNQNQTVTTFTTTVHSVPIGFVMNVTPQVSDNDSVVLNLRPSLSRIIGQAADPNPALREQNIVNNIPIIRSREIESVIRVDNGNIAVMGGLMEDLRDDTDDAVPLLHRIPVVGELFTNRNDTGTKTELVIFLRPTVIHDGSLEGDYRAFRDQLPAADFLDRPRQPGLQLPGASASSAAGDAAPR